MSTRVTAPLLLGILLNAAPAMAYTISSIDGNLSDWGVSHNGNAADWNPAAGIFSTVEDQNTTFLSPGYGGQAYDAEAMYVAYDSTNLYIAIATGHNPATVESPRNGTYATGDIAIDLGNNGIWEYGLETYGGNAGRVLKNPTWSYGIWSDSATFDREAHPASMSGGSLVGQATLRTSGPHTGYGEYAGNHYFYEAAIPLSFFGDDWTVGDFTVHWTQNCANDTIQVSATNFPLNTASDSISVPEPGTLALLPLGLAGLGLLRRRASAQ